MLSKDVEDRKQVPLLVEIMRSLICVKMRLTTSEVAWTGILET